MEGRRLSLSKNISIALYNQKVEHDLVSFVNTHLYKPGRDLQQN